MKLLITDTFPGITVSDYEALYFDEAFTIALAEAVKIGRTLLRLDRAPDRVVRHVRCEPIRDIPGPVAMVLGGRRFAYAEEIDFRLGEGEGAWRVVPNVAADKVRAEGTLHFELADGGVRRIVRGEVSIPLLGIGGLLERVVVAEVEKSYEQASAFTRKYLERMAAP
jgi:hypothetical protein